MKITVIPVLIAFFYTAIYTKSIKNNSCDNVKYGAPCVVSGNPCCVNDECLLAFKPTPQPILIKICYPKDNIYAQNKGIDVFELYLRGNGLGLSWKKGKKMKKSRENDTWEFQVEFAIPGVELSSSKKPGTSRFEFRVYLNDLRDMLGPNFVLNLPLSTSTKNITTIPEFWEYPWYFTKKVREIKRKIYSPELEETREVIVVLPPSFQENIYKRYETLIVNDGQHVNMMVPQLTALMIERALIKEVLVVGITNDDIYENRVPLLAPSNGTIRECINGHPNTSDCNGCVQCRSVKCGNKKFLEDFQRCHRRVKIPKVRGQLYLDFIQYTVIPECKSKYRALTDAEHFGIMGFSMGGLISCHAIWTRPQVFRSAACMSSSFFWPFFENASSLNDAGFEFTTKTLMQFRGERPRQKIYIDIGSKELEIMISAARNASRILSSTPYFELNQNLWFYIWKGEYHTFHTAVHRMWVPLIAFYGTEGSSHANQLTYRPSIYMWY